MKNPIMIEKGQGGESYLAHISLVGDFSISVTLDKQSYEYLKMQIECLDECEKELEESKRRRKND